MVSLYPIDPDGSNSSYVLLDSSLVTLLMVYARYDLQNPLVCFPRKQKGSAFSAIWLRRKLYRFYRNCVLYVGSSLVMSLMAHVRYNIQNLLVFPEREMKVQFLLFGCQEN